MKKWMILTVGLTALSLSACSQSTGAETEERVARLEAQVQNLNDMNEIKLLQEQFANLADQKDAEAQMKLFTEDSQVILNINGESRTLDGAAEIGEAFANTLNSTDILYHMNGQGTIQVNGDTATGVAYCRVVMIDTEDGVISHTDEGIRYTDEYVKQDGKWLIARRTSDFMFVDREQTPDM